MQNSSAPQASESKPAANEKIVRIPLTASFAFGLLAADCFLGLSMVIAFLLGLNFGALPEYYAYAMAPMGQAAAIVGLIFLAILLAAVWVAFEVGLLKRLKIRDVEQGTGYGMLFGLTLWVVFGLIATQLLAGRVLSQTTLFSSGDVGLLVVSELVGFFLYGLVAGYAFSVERRSRLKGG